MTATYRAAIALVLHIRSIGELGLCAVRRDKNQATGGTKLRRQMGTTGYKQVYNRTRNPATIETTPRQKDKWIALAARP